MIRVAALIGMVFLAQNFYQEGAAASCDNGNMTPRSHRCACSRGSICPMPGEKIEPNGLCKTYCKPEHCHCCPACERPK